MAKVAKIFCKQGGTGNSAVYTVPANKYAIANLAMQGTNSSTGLRVNGDETLVGGNVFASGMVFPAGTTLQLQVASGTGGILTGFEYDV